LSLSGTLLIGDAAAARGVVDVEAPSRSSATTATAETGQRSSWPHRLVWKLDGGLRRLYGVREFSDRPRCLLRIAIRRADASLRLADGYEVARGDEIVELHLWNEHLSSLSPRGSGLGAAAVLRRQIDSSLSELSGHIESEPSLAGITALRARTALVPRKRLQKLLRIASAYGFDSVTSDAPDPLVTRLHDVCENFLIWALAWTFNPNALRRNGLLRSRCELWISRGALMSRYRPSIDESTVAEGATSSSPRAASISNFPSLPWPGESAARYCASTRDYLKAAG
jgi:hypothetical protein